MLESITIREAFPRSKACGGDQERVKEIKRVWRRSRACGGERERVAEWVIQRKREDPSEEEARKTLSERETRT